MTRASVEVSLEDLDDGKIEIHRTEPVWLLARNTVPLPYGTRRRPHGAT